MEASYMNIKKLFITLILAFLVLLPANSLADANLQGQLSKNSAKMADVYRERLNEVQDESCLTNKEITEEVKDYSNYLSEQDEAFLQSVETMITPDIGGGCIVAWPGVDEPSPESMQSTSITTNDESMTIPEDGFSTDAARVNPNWKLGLVGYWSLCTLQYYADLNECRHRCTGFCSGSNCYSDCAQEAFHRYMLCMAFRG